MTAPLAGPVTDAAPLAAEPLLAVRGIDVVLGRGWRASQVLSGVDLKIWPGEIVGLVGETGSGKTTLARTVVGLVRPRKGRIVFDGTEISGLRGGARRRERRSGHVQLVFQDPLRSLDPELTVAQIVGEGLRIRGGLDAAAIERSVLGALRQVGLDAALLHRTPGQISGGQRQRVSIARALATDPRLLLCDEPVSALDASNRNYILRLLGELRDTLGLPIVIISHDLSCLAGIADRVVVLYRGRIVEDGPVGQVFTAPRHPYTALLMASAPSVRHDRPLSVHQLRRTAADPPPPTAAGACVFAARCPFAISACARPASSRPRSPPASSPRSTSSATAGSPCTSSPAAATPSSAGTATTCPRTSGTPARTSTWTLCSWPGPRRPRSPTRARITSSRTTGPLSGRTRTRGSGSTSADRPRRPSGSAASTPTPSPCGGEPLAETKQQIDAVHEAARNAGRASQPGISVSFRPILGPTTELAWERAHRILQDTKENIAALRAQWGIGPRNAGDTPENVGSQRLLAAAAKGELHDRALWTPLAAASGAGGNSTALVGTPDTVAQAILDYIDIGVTTILIRGYDPYDDAIDYGRYLLPLVREEVARRDAERARSVVCA